MQGSLLMPKRLREYGPALCTRLSPAEPVFVRLIPRVSPQLDSTTVRTSRRIS